MAWRQIADKPLSEPTLTRFTLMHICGSRGRWVTIMACWSQIKICMKFWWHGTSFCIATYSTLWEKTPITRGFPSQMINDAELWCFLCSLSEQSVEQSVELPMIWPAIMLMRRHRTGLMSENLGNPLYSSSAGQNGRHFADDVFRCIFVNEKFSILIKISLKCAYGFNWQ